MNSKQTKHFEKFFKRAVRDVRKGDVFIPVLGPTGSGKSTFINNLLGSHCSRPRAEISHGYMSCTLKCEMYILDPPTSRQEVYKTLQDRLIFVDTPGFDDSRLSDWQVVNEIGKALLSLYRKDIRVAGVVYMLPIFPGRRNRNEEDNVATFQSMYGSNRYFHVALATTRWSLCDEVTGSQREEEILRTMWGNSREDAVIKRLHDTPDSAWEVVDAVISRFAYDQERIRLSDIEIFGEAMKAKKQKSGWGKQIRAVASVFRRLLAA